METAETNLERSTKKKVFYMSSNIKAVEAEAAVLEVK
jgi:hypothetical protein